MAPLERSEQARRLATMTICSPCDSRTWAWLRRPKPRKTVVGSDTRNFGAAPTAFHGARSGPQEIGSLQTHLSVFPLQSSRRGNRGDAANSSDDAGVRMEI